MHKDHRRFVRQLEAQGFEAVPTRKSHLWVIAPNGERHLLATTTANRRALVNLRVWAKRQLERS